MVYVVCIAHIHFLNQAYNYGIFIQLMEGKKIGDSYTVKNTRKAL